MPAINIGDAQIQLQTIQNTTPSLKFMTSDGALYYADISVGKCPNSLVISDGTTSYTIGSSQLIYSATNFDSCETVSLAAGCYTAYVMGGRGGDGGNNAGNGSDATVATYSFNLIQPTDIYIFRGGDGNPGTFNTSGDGMYSAGGGGASGAPSFIQVGTEYIISQGGNGGNGAGGYKSNTEQNCGAGGGGSATTPGDGLVATGTDAWGSDGFVCGSGGGGAQGGKAGAASSGFLYNGSTGADATDTGGGAGGNSSMGSLFGSSSGTGGTGGANVSWSCGTQIIYSYGGGGGGAISTGGLFGTGIGVNGGNGGSGSSGSSTTSYVKIYKIG